MKEKFKEIFLTKTRDEWCALMENTDICFAPVLSLSEAPDYAHNRERGSFVDVDGVMHPAPAPRFSATPSSIKSPTPVTGVHTDEVLADWGISADKVAALKASGAIKA